MAEVCGEGNLGSEGNETLGYTTEKKKNLRILMGFCIW
jgi:hypothetical protein